MICHCPHTEPFCIQHICLVVLGRPTPARKRNAYHVYMCDRGDGGIPRKQMDGNIEMADFTSLLVDGAWLDIIRLVICYVFGCSGESDFDFR